MTIRVSNPRPGVIEVLFDADSGETNLRVRLTPREALELSTDLLGCINHDNAVVSDMKGKR